MSWWMWVALVIGMIVLVVAVLWLLTEGRDRRRWNKAMNKPAFRAAFESKYGVSLSGTATAPRPKTIEKPHMEFTNWRERSEMTGMETAVAVLSSSPGTKWGKAVNEMCS